MPSTIKSTNDYTHNSSVPGKELCSDATTLIPQQGFWKNDTENWEPIALYVDFSKAIDTVPHGTILWRSSDIGIGGISKELSKCLLTYRLQYVQKRDEIWKDGVVINGVQQGSILEPILFFSRSFQVTYEIVSSPHVVMKSLIVSR